MSEDAHICGLLAAARIQARGGRPLSDAEIDLCAVEALLLLGAVGKMAHGCGVPETMNPRVESARTRVRAEHASEYLDATLDLARASSAGAAHRL